MLQMFLSDIYHIHAFISFYNRWSELRPGPNYVPYQYIRYFIEACIVCLKCNETMHKNLNFQNDIEFKITGTSLLYLAAILNFISHSLFLLVYIEYKT